MRGRAHSLEGAGHLFGKTDQRYSPGKNPEASSERTCFNRGILIAGATVVPTRQVGTSWAKHAVSSQASRIRDDVLPNTFVESLVSGQMRARILNTSS